MGTSLLLAQCRFRIGDDQFDALVAYHAPYWTISREVRTSEGSLRVGGQHGYGRIEGSADQSGLLRRDGDRTDVVGCRF